MESLVERRLLPPSDRDRFHYEVVRFHLEDLNAIAERRQARRGRARTAAPDLARVRAIVQAARWDRVSFARAIGRFVDDGRAGGEDAFGPALLLMALEVPDRGFLRSVSRSVRALVDTMLGEAAGGAARTGSRPRGKSKLRKPG